MKIVRFQKEGSPLWGVKRDDQLFHLQSLADTDQVWNRLSNRAFLRQLKNQIEYGDLNTYSYDNVSILPPVDQPSKIINVGLNYEAHIEEQNTSTPDNPLLFAKAPSSIIGHQDTIVLPAGVEQVDYEVELAVVIGRTARHLSADEVQDYIAGYTILNDISARDAQFADGQFFRGKSYDTFAPLGPALRVGKFDVDDTVLELHVNGTRKQHSHTGNLIFDVEELITFITSTMTLQPGDVVSTGTPANVGIFRDPPDLLNPGDRVEATIEGIGTLSNQTADEIT